MPVSDEDDERVERDLPEQERPVVGEDVAQRLAQEGSAARALVEEAGGATDHSRTPAPGRARPAPEKPPSGDQLALRPDGQRELRERPAGRAEEDRAARRGVEGRVVAWTDERGPRPASARSAARGRAPPRSPRACRSSSRRRSAGGPVARGRRAGRAAPARAGRRRSARRGSRDPRPRGTRCRSVSSSMSSARSTPSLLVDEPDTAAPRLPPQPARVEDRPERGERREQGDSERSSRAACGQAEQLAPGQVPSALDRDLLHLGHLRRVEELGVRLLGFLRRRQAKRRHDRRDGERGEASSPSASPSSCVSAPPA